MRNNSKKILILTTSFVVISVSSWLITSLGIGGCHTECYLQYQGCRNSGIPLSQCQDEYADCLANCE